jgi:hypothetical protein
MIATLENAMEYQRKMLESITKSTGETNDKEGGLSDVDNYSSEDDSDEESDNDGDNVYSVDSTEDE